MTDFFATVDGNRAQTLHIYAGARGPWYADAILDDSTALNSRVTIKAGSLTLVGTPLPSTPQLTDQSGQAILRGYRIVGGADGWGNLLRQKFYHDDRGLQAETIASDAARECGEKLGTTDLSSILLETTYTRRFGPGSLALDRLVENTGLTWWVDQSGVTQIGQRPTLTPRAGSYQLDTYSAINRLAEISLDDPGDLWVGSVLTDRLSTPQMITDYEVHVDKNKCRVRAFTGGDLTIESRIGRALDALLDLRDQRRLFGKYRYRVFSTDSSGRANLQAVRPQSGLPDVLPVTLRPGAPGLWGQLVEGAEVFVEFEAGDPALAPMLTACPGKGEQGHVPTKLEIAGGGAPVARMGDAGIAFFPPLIPIAGTIAGVGAFTAVATITTPAPVQITSGSGIVESG